MIVFDEPDREKESQSQFQMCVWNIVCTWGGSAEYYPTYDRGDGDGSGDTKYRE